MCLRITAKHAPPPSDAPSSVASTKYTNKPLGNKQFFALMNMNRNFAGQDLLHLGMRSTDRSLTTPHLTLPNHDPTIHFELHPHRLSPSAAAMASFLADQSMVPLQLCVGGLKKTH
jgi:hypothetical protein